MKYDGWLGTIYRRERYVTRGRFSRQRFEAGCLAEYAGTFPIVCGDFAFYQFPTREFWDRLFAETPASFRFAFKVPEEITVARWPAHPRQGDRGGKENPAFLDEALFRTQFTRPLEPHAGRVAALVFEFGAFSRSTFATRDEFLARLDRFLGSLPAGFRYGVEIRNPEFLGPRYFDLLANHRVAHVFNAWTRMPSLLAQVEMPGAFTTDYAIVRALLSQGRSYEEAVKTFSPYQLVRAEPRSAGCLAADRRPLGHAPEAGVSVRQQPP